jgi:hypothetical protein
MVLLVGVGAGGVVAVVLLARGHSARSSMAYGPFLCLGALIALIYTPLPGCNQKATPMTERDPVERDPIELDEITPRRPEATAPPDGLAAARQLLALSCRCISSPAPSRTKTPPSRPIWKASRGRSTRRWSSPAEQALRDEVLRLRTQSQALEALGEHFRPATWTGRRS